MSVKTLLIKLGVIGALGAGGLGLTLTKVKDDNLGLILGLGEALAVAAGTGAVLRNYRSSVNPGCQTPAQQESPYSINIKNIYIDNRQVHIHPLANPPVRLNPGPPGKPPRSLLPYTPLD